ncbi:selenocysteine insertion sequence-binding protein 2 isoform X1 [Varanus komodoensis]|uniref:selenocysteine insertion sequence-binding protein 2 isoform X1 n=1 Tax=Varanus komodoensis TaxID=61221 RepID=UPI001CF7B4A8|nr:selenocysteine insertion sequence-binding protein 2 isoform X1 [Varanus komodoensis]
MTPEREAGSQGIKLSAEVKPFVPKYTAVKVAWSEPSEACVFPRYYTTCYPYVQEPPVNKPQVYTQDVFWEPTTPLSQYASQNPLGNNLLEEYTSPPYSVDATPNVYSVASFQCENNNPKFYNSSRQDRDYAKQTSLQRKGAASLPRRRPKDHESKLEDKRPEQNDFSSKSTESTSYTLLHGRNPIKSERPIKAVNGKFKQNPNNECLPEPAFEITLSDFPKLQGLGSSDLLDLKKHTWESLRSAEGDKLPLNSSEKTAVSAFITKEGEVPLKKHFPERPLSSSSDPGVPQVCSGYFTEAPVSWATVLSQTLKRVVSTPAAALANNQSDSKAKDAVPEACTPEARENTSDKELEETADKKKKKKRKKKKAKQNNEGEDLHTNISVQEPPRIEDDDEFPNLAAATDKKYKPGTQNTFYAAPISRQQTEVRRQESESESPSGHSQNELVTPKPDISSEGKPRKHALPAPGEKWKPQKPSKSSGKKSQIPVQLDLGNMLAALEQKQCAEKSKQSKPVVLSVGGAVTLLSKESMTVTKSQQLNQGKVPHNPLDSSAPLVKKGKQREVPKAKKPTALRKIILKEREQRKQQHLLEQTAKPQDDAVQQGAETTSEVVSEDSKADSTEEYPIDPLTQGSSQVPLKCTEEHGPTENALVQTRPNSSLPKIHSRRFRDYCTQVLSKEVDSCVTDLLKELVRFQDRLYQKDPVKAKTKRRLVMGLREVLKHLKLKKLKCVIISPNCEKIQSKGGLDETLHLIIDSACEQNIPFVFALSRKALGHCVNKAVPVSVVGIFSYDGAQDYFHKMVELTMEARKAYKDMIAALEREPTKEENGSDCVPAKAHCGANSPVATGDAPLPEHDEDVPDYIKIWKRKLEEEYNPYMLELEKQATTEMLTLSYEEPQ